MHTVTGSFRHVTSRLLRAARGAIAHIGAAQKDAPGRCRTAVIQAHVRPPAALDAAATEDSRAHALAGINRYDQFVMVQWRFLGQGPVVNGP
jgi:hypothetical protein